MSRYDTFQYVKNKAADQTARMRRLVCTFVVCKPPIDKFSHNEANIRVIIGGMRVKIQHLFSTSLLTVQYFDSRETPIFYMYHRHPLQHLLSHSPHSVHCALVGRLSGVLCPHQVIKMEPEKHIDSLNSLKKF